MRLCFLWDEPPECYPSSVQVEWQFWNLVQTPDRPLEVLYGSDLDTMRYGSGFPRPAKPETAPATAAAAAPPAPSPIKGAGKAKGKEAKEEPAREKELPAVRRYATAGWNLNNLCRLDRCVLAHANDDISGMVVPWLYVGMLFASFCWHVEDHYAHSINYMHWGAPKTWYGVPGDEADAFEEVMRHAVPELVDSEAGLLYKMVTMVPPGEAVRAGVRVCHLLQQPGTFVVTWPRAYHAGFSHGVNCAESSNFATPDWLPWGRASVDAFRTVAGCRRPCFTHELLLTTLARKAAHLSAHISWWVEADLAAIIRDERAHLAALAGGGIADAVDARTGQPLTLAHAGVDAAAGAGVDAAAGAGVDAAAGAGVDAAAGAGADADATVSSSVDGAAARAGEMSVDGAGETADAWGGGTCPECAACQYECFLSVVECTGDDGQLTHLCPMHAFDGPALVDLCASEPVLRAAQLPASRKRVRVYRSVEWLRSLHQQVSTRAEEAAAWIGAAKRIVQPSAPTLERGKAEDASGSAAVAVEADGAASPPRATLAEAQAALAAGARLRMDDEYMLLLTTACTKGASVSSRVATLSHALSHSKRGARPSLEACQSCVRDADALPIRFGAVAELRPVVAAGERWEEQAHAALRALTRTDGSDAAAGTEDAGTAAARLAHLEGLLADAAAFPLSLPSRAEVEGSLALARFEALAAQLLAASHSEVAGGDEGAAAAPGAAQTSRAGAAAGESAATDCNATTDGGVTAASATTDGGAAPPPPSLTELSAAVKQGRAVEGRLSSSSRASLAALASRLADGQGWVDQSAAAMRQKGTTVATLRGLVDRYQFLRPLVALPAATRDSLRERLAAAEAWLLRARALLDGRLLTPGARGADGDGHDDEDVRDVLACAKPLAKVHEVDVAVSQLASAVKLREGWLGRCAEIFVKPGCETPLLALLQGEAGAWPPGDEESSHCCPCCSPDQPVPLGGAPSGAEVTWVGCDSCDAWFHAPCARVPDGIAESLESFECPRCAEMRGAAYAFTPPGGAPPPIMRTRRPPPTAVAKLLAEADEHNLRLPETAAVRVLLSSTTRWRETLRRTVAATDADADAADAAASAGAVAMGMAPQSQAPRGIAAIPPPALAALLHEAGKLEVMPPELPQLNYVAARRGMPL